MSARTWTVGKSLIQFDNIVPPCTSKQTRAFLVGNKVESAVAAETKT